MKKSRLFSFLFIGVIFLSGCSDFISESADLNATSELILKSKKVPVKVEGEFSVWVNVPPEPVNGVLNQLEYGASIEPHPAHLGITELYNEEVIYLSANTGQVPWDQVDPWIANGDVIFTAANGDELFIELNYEIDPGLFPQLAAEGQGIVTGGSGRFEKATGTFNFSAEFNVSESKGIQFYSGEIMY